MQGAIAELINLIETYGLERFGKYYSIYEGQVSDNEDPQKQGRLKVRVPKITNSQTIGEWAYPLAPVANGAAFLSLPQKGDTVAVMFTNGDIRFPYWVGAWWGKKDNKTELPEEAQTDYPLLHIWITPEKQRIVLNDKTKQISIIDANGNEINMQGGKMLLSVKDAGSITINNTILELNGADEAAVLGDKLQGQVNLLNAKFEALCAALAAWTPTGNPVVDIGALKTAITAPVAMTAADFSAILSQIVKLK